VLIACTFIGHGVFAIGYHGIPDNFMQMTTRILGISAVTAEQFLFIIGMLDIAAALLIFASGRWQKAGLIYMITPRDC
jgi:hypothetical protein